MRDDDDFAFGRMNQLRNQTPIEPGTVAIPIRGQNGLKYAKNQNCTTIYLEDTDLRCEANLGAVRTQIQQLLNDSDCEIIRFDLKGVPYMPSGVIGIMVSIMNRGFEVEIASANDAIRYSLAVARLDSFVRMLD